MKKYQIELRSEKYGYCEFSIFAHDLQDADNWAQNKARMMSRGDIVKVSNVVEKRNDR